MVKLSGHHVIILLVVLLVLFFIQPKWFKSTYNIFSEGGTHTMGGTPPTTAYAQISGDSGLATSLLPKEIPSQEDFGKFSPEAIMRGQNYLDPRSQIGYPETIGGNIRNANYDVRSEPQNPRVPVSIFSQSTIVPDTMRPQFEIGR